MKRIFVLLVSCLLLLSSSSVSARGVSSLIERLAHGADFRVRVTAALDLGKTKSARAKGPLVRALDDGNAAVRAAAAAALSVLGDPSVIPALRKHRKDSSAAVRSQIKSSIKNLRRARRAARKRVLLVVEVGKMRNGSGQKSRKLLKDLESTSRSSLSGMPGVVVSEDAEPKHKRLPRVMISGKLSKLERRLDGKQVVYTARVEFIVHQMPSRAIKGKVSGSATARVDTKDVRTKKSMRKLRHEVMVAAIQSAMRRAPEALKAAAGS